MTPGAPSQRGRAIVMLSLSCGAWGLSFPGGKVFMAALEQELPGRNSWVFSALTIGGRFALGALVLWLFHPRALWRTTASEWRQAIGLGLMGGLGILVQADGLTHTEASTSAFLTQFSAVLVPIYVALRDRRFPSPLTIFCVALVMTGVGILGRFDWHALRLGRGELETLISTMFFTAQILWLERPIFRGNHTGRVTLAMFAVIAAVNLPVFVFNSHAASDALAIFASVPIFALLAGLTFFCSLIAFLMMNRFQPHMDATTAGIIYCAEPLYATIFALFLPGMLAAALGLNGVSNETMTTHLVLGGSLITVANLLIAWNPGGRVPKPL
jgi:drug/metabolite transporter (DMT)-like permease